MKLFLLRHGDRSSGYGDVPLSTEGLRQAQALAESPALQKVDLILCSPKIRTQQTIDPIAEKLGVPVQIENALDQRKSIETESEFTQRILTFLDHCAANFSQKNILLCSHSDWLQTAVLSMPSTRADNSIYCFFSCAEFKVLTYKDGLWDIS